MSKTIDGITQPREWAKHLRKFGKRTFWKRHRRAEKKLEKDKSVYSFQENEKL